MKYVIMFAIGLLTWAMILKYTSNYAITNFLKVGSMLGFG